MKRFSLPAALVLSSCLACVVACSVAPTLIEPLGVCECPAKPSDESTGTTAADETGDPTTGTTGPVCDLPKKP